MTRALAVPALVLFAILLGPGAAAAVACVCVDEPLEDRLDAADAAVVGRVVSVESGELRGAPQRLLTVEVDQRVKGGVEKTILVRSPEGTDCDVEIPRNRATGLLLTASPEGAWLASSCSVVDAGELVVVGGEPRGGPIKVAVGLVILGLVLLLAFVRLRRGSRPQLPGDPPGGRASRV